MTMVVGGSKTRNARTTGNGTLRISRRKIHNQRQTRGSGGLILEEV
jgi:hypothetical protein